MEVNEVFEKVKNLFVEELGLDADKVTMDAKLEEDLEIGCSCISLSGGNSSCIPEILMSSV